MTLIENTRYSELKNKPVFDSKGVKLGRVIDIVFSTTDSVISINSIVLGDSPFEEFLEKIGSKPDMDPIICKTYIKSIDEDIELTDTKDSIAEDFDKCKLDDTLWTFTKLAKLPIVDSNGNEIGNIIDVWFDSSGGIWFIVGGGTIEEILEKVGILPDIDLLVSPRTIKEFTQDAITITWNVDDIEAACENAPDSSEIMIRS
ncbi:MAG: hypothetical protein GF411_12685 [Candidatus Lokiarchaeota archaeon]|nr:hypothetical protein [Candidatus Lokiarchaeota archaeon]